MMARRPNFATLLRVRYRQEELKAQALANAQRRVHSAEREREAIEMQQVQTLERAGSVALSKRDLHRVQQYHRFERHLAQRAVQKDAQIITLKEQAREKRGEVKDAMTQRRTVERLIERLNEKIRYAHQQREQKLNDELVLMRAGTRRRSVRPD